MTDIATIEAKRAARKAALAEQSAVQRAVDLEALDALEVELGDESVEALDVPFAAGSVTLAVWRVPRPAEVKRYQHRLKAAKPDTAEAAEEVGAVCMVYPPSGEIRDALLGRLPGLLVQGGQVALGLATGRAQSEGKG